MGLYRILPLDLLTVLHYNKSEHYDRNTKKEEDMEVEIIKANNPFDESSKVRKVDRLRVAAYCRVSTDDEDQIKSYNSMVNYYTLLYNFINDTPVS